MKGDPFEVLGVPATITSDALKRHWRQLASQHHPDHGGDGARFHELRQAYEQALRLTETPLVCPVCQGQGRVKRGGFMSVALICNRCGGTGTIDR